MARFLRMEWLADRTGDLADVDGKKVETDMDFARIVTANAVVNIGDQLGDETPIFNILTLIVHAPMDELMQMC